MKYGFSLSDDALQSFSEFSRRERDGILRLMRSITDAPERTANVCGIPVKGRECTLCIADGWSFVYWLDHPIREVRSVVIERAD